MKVSPRLAFVLDSITSPSEMTVEDVGTGMSWRLGLFGTGEPETLLVFVQLARALDEQVLNADVVVDPAAGDAVVDEVLDGTPLGHFTVLYADLFDEPFDPRDGGARLAEVVRTMVKHEVRRMLERAVADPRWPGRGGLAGTDGTVWRSKRQKATPITWERTRD